MSKRDNTLLAGGRFRRLGELDREPVPIEIDGMPAMAREGDTLLVAVLTNVGSLRLSEFGDGARAGFCLMGSCQDCWVWTPEGMRLQACATPVAPDTRILTKEAPWPRLG